MPACYLGLQCLPALLSQAPTLEPFVRRDTHLLVPVLIIVPSLLAAAAATTAATELLLQLVVLLASTLLQSLLAHTDSHISLPSSTTTTTTTRDDLSFFSFSSTLRHSSWQPFGLAFFVISFVLPNSTATRLEAFTAIWLCLSNIYLQGKELYFYFLNFLQWIFFTLIYFLCFLRVSNCIANSRLVSSQNFTNTNTTTALTQRSANFKVDNRTNYPS